MFKTEFKVVEIRESGVTVTSTLKGKKNLVKEDIEHYKKHAKKYEMFKKGMVVWM